MVISSFSLNPIAEVLLTLYKVAPAFLPIPVTVPTEVTGAPL